ncbi:MAG: hypothetical protein ABFD62_13380 [Syntrophaceae bacterium]
MRSLSINLVRLIERNTDKLTRRVMEDIKKHPGAGTYRNLDEAQLYKRVFEVYHQFNHWMSDETTKEDIERVYRILGKQRQEEGFALSEVIQALIIARRHIWLLVDSESFLDTALDLHNAIDLVNRSILFFDRAIYFTAVGYEKMD